MKSSIILSSNAGRGALILALAIFALRAPSAAAGVDKLDRTVLPIPAPKRAPITELDVRKAKAPPRFDLWRRFGYQIRMVWRSPIALTDKLALTTDVGRWMRHKRDVLWREFSIGQRSTS